MGLCQHLEDYGVQFAATESAYRRCVILVDAVLADGPGDGRAADVTRAVEEWRQQDARLRELLVELVRAGRVRVPRRLTVQRAHRTSHIHGSLVCAACRRSVPRLRYAEWQFAHNGVVSYRGNDFRLPQPAGA